MTIAPLTRDESGAAPPAQTGPVDDARILIVDDDPSAVVLMLRLLERDGFRRVVAVGDGRSALDSMLERPPELVVLDVHMPHLDGFETLREIINRQQRVADLVAVLAVSGDGSPNTCHAMLSSGADDFLARPFSGSEFALRVRRLVKANRELRHAIRYALWLEACLGDAQPSSR